jgi:CBS domain-containing protein
MKTVRQVLQAKGSAVHAISPAATVFDALKVMAEKNVGALVVMDGARLVGLVSERDYARKVVLLGRVSKDTPVADIMTREVVCVEPAKGMDECMAIMTEGHFRHLPVMDEESLAGIISIGDVVKSLLDHQQFTIEQLEHYIVGSH